MSTIADGVKGRKRKTTESGSQEELSKMKKLKAQLLPVSLSTAEVGNTPKDAQKEMGKQWEAETTETHITDPNNPAFKKLFDDGKEGEGKEGEGEATATGKEQGGDGKGFWSFLGIGGRKRRRRKKSRKKNKSKRTKRMARKSRRRRKRGGDGDLKEKMKKMFRNSAEINMPCDTPFGACNTARNKAREVDSDLGQAWVDYQVDFIKKNKGKMGRSMGVNRVKQRLRNYYDYFNDLDAETKAAMEQKIIYQPEGIESIMAGGRRRKSG